MSIIITQLFLPESLSKKKIVYEKRHFHFGSFIKSLIHQPLLFFYLVNLFIFWSQSGIFTTLSLFGKDVLSLSVVKVSLLFAFGGFLSAFIQGFAIGRMVKLISEESLLIISLAITSSGLSVMSFAKSVFPLFLGITVFAIGNSILVPIVQSLVSKGSSAHEQGGSLGVLQSFGAIGRIIGPIIAGFVYQQIGPSAPSIMGVIIYIAILIFAVIMLVPLSQRKKLLQINSIY